MVTTRSQTSDKNRNLCFGRLDSPIGELLIVCHDATVCAIEFGAEPDRLMSYIGRRFPGLELMEAVDPCGVTSRLRDYFAGAVHAIDDLPVDCGGTPFQARVWNALRQIPAGTVVSYGELARRIGHPTAVRAVGLANGSNPIPVIVPCHRVIGSNGTLTGYGGGLDRKRWLLEHEGVQLGLPFGNETASRHAGAS